MQMLKEYFGKVGPFYEGIILTRKGYLVLCHIVVNKVNHLDKVVVYKFKLAV